jgi:methionyl-tRNA formyltransferase
MGDTTDVETVQRCVIWQLLRGDRHPTWTFDDLHQELYDIPPDVLRQAVKTLETERVIETAQDPQLTTWATAAPRFLDRLGLIGI